MIDFNSNVSQTEWDFSDQYFHTHPDEAKLSKKHHPITHSFVRRGNQIFALTSKLGKGVTGKVKVSQSANGANTAVKIIPHQQPNVCDTEILVLQSLQRFRGHFTRCSKGTLKTYLFQELIEGDCLWDKLCDPYAVSINDPNAYEQNLIYAILMVEAAHELHLKNIIHGDLKLENMMVKGHGNNTKLNLVDFSFSKIVQMNQTEVKSDTNPHTPGYAAPEILNAVEGKYTYSFASDVYALGKIFQEKLYLPHEVYHSLIYPNRNERSSLKQVREKLFSLLNDMDNLSPSTKEFIANKHQFFERRSTYVPAPWKRTYPK